MTTDPITHLHDIGVVQLVEGARRGDYTMPGALLTAYAAVERLQAAQPPEWESPHTGARLAAQEMADAAVLGDDVPHTHVGEQSSRRASAEFVADWRDARATALQQLADRCASAITYQGAAIITEHIQPALEELMTSFAADVRTIGPHASEAAPTMSVVLEREDVREAYVRFAGIHPRYSSIREAWRILRRYDHFTTTDPLGTESPLTECANIHELVEDWWKCANGYGSWPWSGNALHVQLGWLVNAGARVWTPTAQQQSEVWQAVADTVTKLPRTDHLSRTMRAA